MGEFYWSSTKVNAANYCDMRYYLRYLLGARPLRISAYVKGSLLHQVIENFHDCLGTPEEVESSSKKFKDKKYHDAESFTKYMKGKFMSIIMADERLNEKFEAESNPIEKEKMREHLITWSYKGEPYIILNSHLARLGRPLFEYLKKQGPPQFAEIPFDFKVGTERFKGRLDALRKNDDGKISVIDYKSGNPWVGKMKLAHDPQLTLYNAGICALIKFDPNLRKILGLEGKVEEFMAGQKFISPNISEGFFMIESLSVDPEKVKSMPEIVYETTRTDDNFFELIKMVKSVSNKASCGDVYPERGKKCDSCDMKEACDKELLKVNKGNYFDKKDNLLLDFAMPQYARKEDVGEISFATTDTDLPGHEKPAAQPLTRSEMNKIQPKFRFRYPKKIEPTEIK